MRSYKHLFSRALAAAPGRMHFAAHSHHLWPDASHEGHLAAWQDAAALADSKWDKVMGEVVPQAQAQIARELKLPDPRTIAFGTNTHELVTRIFSARLDRQPIEVLTSDGEFHSVRRQLARWQEQGTVRLRLVPSEPFGGFTERYLAAMAEKAPDIAFVSHIMFNSGLRFDGIAALAALAEPQGTWVIVDGYHAFMAFPVDLSTVAERVFYLGGGYKYAMAGEGACFVHAPPGFAARPLNTGWFAEFAAIEARVSGVAYSSDGARLMGATFDPSGLYRFNAVRAMLESEGLDTAAIHAHAEALRTKMENAIAAGKAGRLQEAECLRPNAQGPQPRFLALRDERAGEWKARLLERNIVTDARGDVLRIGFGLYHDEADLDVLCEALGRLAL